MLKLIPLLFVPLLLTGCIGCYIGGHKNRLSDEYPDIRNVPERAEAIKSFGVHKGNEKTARASDFKSLETDREKLQARNEALREGRFPDLPKEESAKKPSRDGKDGLSKSAGRGKAALSGELEPKDGATSSDQTRGIFDFDL